MARMLARRRARRILVRIPDEKRQFGRSRPKLENNIKKDFQEVGWGSIDWIDLVKDRDRWRAIVNAVMNIRVP